MKKLVCWLLLIALAVSISPAALAEGESAPPAPWAAADVEEAVALGMVPEGLQSDWQSDLTRGEFAELVVRFLAVQYGYGAGTGFQMEDFWEDYLNLRPDPNGRPFVKADYYPELAQTPDRFMRWDYLLGEYARFFDDVEPGNRADDIGLAYLLGIVEGRGDGTYDPDGIITRQEAAALLARAYQVYAELETPPTAAEPFSDSALIAPWAQESVSAMQGWGVLQGDENGALCPEGHYTREQGVVTLMRLYRNMPVSRYNGTLAPLLSYADLVERLRAEGNSWMSAVRYEAETEICTILYVTYGGVMHASWPNLFLIYPDSTYKRIGLNGYVEDGFQLNEDETRLTFSDGTPRVLDLRAGIYVAAADERLEQLKKEGTVEGFYHRPFDELPQALRDTLVWDGQVSTMEGYAFRLRRYEGPGIVITTTEVEDETLRAFLESQSLLPEAERECDPGDVWEEYEREKDREWLYAVTITDDSYATLLGLKVGNTVAEAEALGYRIDPEQLSGLGYAACGDTWDHHLNVYVENGVVTRLDLNWGIGRYTGKYWDLVTPPTAQTRDDAAA